MGSPASVHGHPIHPMLVVFPIGLWVFSFICDIVYHAGSYNIFWKGVGFYTMLGGVLGALVAAVPGFIDYLSLSDRRGKRNATTHMVFNIIVGALFVFNLGVRLNPLPGLEFFGLIFSIVGLGFMAVSGWLGGSLGFF